MQTQTMPKRLSHFAESRVNILTQRDGLIPFSMSETPYLRRIIDVLGSDDHDGAVFVAPSRAGKTSITMPAAQYHSEDGDVLIMAPTRTASSIFLKGDFRKYSEGNPDFRSSDVKVSWATRTNLCGTAPKFISLMDIDRIKGDDIGPDEIWDLSVERVGSYGLSGKVFAESSPSRSWGQSGIVGLYEKGTMERWHWQCLDGCGGFFEAHPDNLRIPEAGSVKRRAAGAHVECPHCGQRYFHDGENGRSDKKSLNRNGVWVPEGARVDMSGQLLNADRHNSRVASFWLTGIAAAWQRWDRMVESLLNARNRQIMTGDDAELRMVTNGDLGIPYSPE